MACYERAPQGDRRLDAATPGAVGRLKPENVFCFDQTMSRFLVILAQAFT
jgi:hypothetical protein